MLAAVSAARAETLYVVEQLMVNVNSAPDASGARVTTIKSGDGVEALERQGDQVHVRLANGTQGWVRKSYLSTDEPLQHRLNERTAEVAKLQQDIARLQGELSAVRAKPATAQTSTADPAAPDPTYFMTPPEAPARPVWHWALGSFVIALGLGYLLGWRMLDRHIRRKYGGLRIY